MTEQPFRTHWHVQTHTDDEDPYVTADHVAALDYAADEMTREADQAYEMISIHGQAREFEDAYNAFMRSETFTNVAMNLQNMVNNANSIQEKRAPLYRDEPRCGPLWKASAASVQNDANVNGPEGFAIYPCSMDFCAPGTWELRTPSYSTVPLSFERDEFTSAWAALADSMRTWADESDAEYGDDGSDRATADSMLAEFGHGTPDPQDVSFRINANDGSDVTFSLTWVPETEEA
jgi:hypothetical protein